MDCKSAEDVNRGGADLKSALGKWANNVGLRYEKWLSPDRGKRLDPIYPKEELKWEKTWDNGAQNHFIKKKIKLKPNFRAENVTGLFKSVKAAEQKIDQVLNIPSKWV